MTDELKARIIEAIKPMEGWCWEEKALALADLIIDTKPIWVVEIGVFGGKSLVPMAMALKENGSGIVCGIDPWKKDAALECAIDPENAKWWQECDLDAILKGCSESIWKHGLDDYTILTRCDAVLSSRTFVDGIVDILHIDGNHSEVVSMRDVTNWLPKVKPGGYIWLDDFHWPTVAKAKATLDSKCEVIRDIVDPEKGSCRLYRIYRKR